jgi:enoyl-CoA hydratase
MPEPYATLLVTRDNAIATVSLHRPEVMNALNATMFDELEHCFAALTVDENVRAILLTGSGDRAFAAGADIRGLTTLDAASGAEFSQRGQHVFTQIERCGKPVIACINGVALGGGCELALACTLRLAADRAKLGLPEAKLGLIPGYAGTQRLPRLIGRAAALRLLLTGDAIPAAEALRLGLVDEVVPAENLMDRAHALAKTIATNAPLATAAALEAVTRGEALPLDEALQIEAEIFARLCASEDKREGVDAFLNKRAPQWTAH